MIEGKNRILNDPEYKGLRNQLMLQQSAGKETANAQEMMAPARVTAGAAPAPFHEELPATTSHPLQPATTSHQLPMHMDALAGRQLQVRCAAFQLTSI